MQSLCWNLINFFTDSCLVLSMFFAVSMRALRIFGTRIIPNAVVLYCIARTNACIYFVRFGIVYHGIQDGLVLLTVGGHQMRYTLHHVLDFDADRKRMSVIVEDENGN